MCRFLWFRTNPSEKMQVSSMGSILARQPHAQSIARRRVWFGRRQIKEGRQKEEAMFAAKDKVGGEPPGIRWEGSQLTQPYIYVHTEPKKKYNGK